MLGFVVPCFKRLFEVYDRILYQEHGTRHVFIFQALDGQCPKGSSQGRGPGTGPHSSLDARLHRIDLSGGDVLPAGKILGYFSGGPANGVKRRRDRILLPCPWAQAPNGLDAAAAKCRV